LSELWGDLAQEELQFRQHPKLADLDAGHVANSQLADYYVLEYQ
jgi:hypothetical protein